ncbi:hypothetical protein SeLEV6574_g00960 [Synchytrium endobioticum]|nr:hypothetical protein SeLEV6574_g00960 [Synchytrium endobioticum]
MIKHNNNRNNFYTHLWTFYCSIVWLQELGVNYLTADSRGHLIATGSSSGEKASNLSPNIGGEGFATITALLCLFNLTRI